MLRHHYGVDVLSENKELNFSCYLGLVLLVIGFFIGLFGFVHAMDSAWGTFYVYRGFAELLFGILFILLGNGLISYGKK